MEPDHGAVEQRGLGWIGRQPIKIGAYRRTVEPRSDRFAHGKTDFLSASIDHCKVFAGQLLGEGRKEDAAVFARVATGLKRLQDSADARLNDLIAKQTEQAPKLTLEDPNKTRIAERAARRRHVVMPILEKREWSRGRFVT
jgi:hypothetical protein